MTEALVRYEGWWVLFHLGVGLALSVLAIPALTRSAAGLRRGGAVALVLAAAAAVAVSGWWIPAFRRFEPLGHEATYADVFVGALSPRSDLGGHEPYVTYPLLRWVHHFLGLVAGSWGLPALLAFHLAARAVGVLAVGLWTFALSRAVAPAVLASAVVVLHPTHAMWGAAVYNVEWPFACLALGCWGAVVGAADPGARRALPWAGWCLGTAALLRVEWVVAGGIAVLWSAVLGWLRSRSWSATASVGLRVGAPWLVAASLGFAHGGTLSSQGGYHDIAGYLELVAHQWSFLDFIGPPGGLFGCLLLAAGVISQRGSGRVVAVSLILGSLAHGLAMVTFNDIAPRHLLPMLLGLVPVLSVGAPGSPTAREGVAGGAPAPSFVPMPPSRARGSPGSWQRWTLAIAAAALLVTGARRVGDVAERYYRSPEWFEASHPGFGSRAVPGETVRTSGCYLITDDEDTWALGVAGSHFNLMDEAEAARHWAKWTGCVIWLYDLRNHRADGLDVAPRADKLRRWFRWELWGHSTLPDGSPVVLFGMVEPPWQVEAPPPRRPPWAQEGAHNPSGAR